MNILNGVAGEDGKVKVGKYAVPVDPSASAR